MSEWIEVEPEEATPEERRCLVRHAVQLHGELAGQALYVTNLSCSGFRALYGGEVAAGQPYPVKVGLGGEVLETQARLVWTQAFGSAGDDGGFEFVELSPDGETLLQNYLQSLSL